MYTYTSNVACSGATSDNYWTPQDKTSSNNGIYYERPAQNGYLQLWYNSGYDTGFGGWNDGLVTLTYGGNDINFGPLIQQCLTPLVDCANKAGYARMTWLVAQSL